MGYWAPNAVWSNHIAAVSNLSTLSCHGGINTTLTKMEMQTSPLFIQTTIFFLKKKRRLSYLLNWKECLFTYLIINVLDLYQLLDIIFDNHLKNYGIQILQITLSLLLWGKFIKIIYIFNYENIGNHKYIDILILVEA